MGALRVLAVQDCSMNKVFNQVGSYCYSFCLGHGSFRMCCCNEPNGSINPVDICNETVEKCNKGSKWVHCKRDLSPRSRRITQAERFGDLKPIHKRGPEWI